MSLKRILLSFVLVLISVFCVLFVTVRPQVKAQEPGLIFYESFDDQSSITANGGTISRSVGFVPGKLGNAADMAGGYVAYPREGNFNYSEGRMEFWVKPILTPGGRYQVYSGGLFDVGTQPDSDILFINLDSMWVEFYGQSATTLLPVPADGWYQVKVEWRCLNSTLAPNYQSISVNGVKSFRLNYGQCVVAQPTDKITFGWSRFYNESGATFDEVKIYDSLEEPAFIKPQSTGLVKLENGHLVVDGKPFFVKSVGYQPTPIGLHPTQSDMYCTPSLYGRDLPLIRGMGANAIRTWRETDCLNGSQNSAFLDALYNHGVRSIRVIADFSMYPYRSSDISTTTAAGLANRQTIKTTFRNYVARYKNHPAILTWAIGNEENLFIASSKFADFYSLANEMAREAYLEEGATYHPVTLINGDDYQRPYVQAVGIPGYLADDASLTYIDIWGLNFYRGNTFGNLFSDFNKLTNKPLLITEYGTDAYSKTTCTESEGDQASWDASLISDALANPGVSIGLSIMEYSDEWWKGNSSFSPCSSAGSTNSTQDPGGYTKTGAHPDNSSNEEWWGVVRVSKSTTALDNVVPRQIYSEIKDLFDPDSDGDGFRDSVENYIGTNPNTACQANAWPPDVDADGVVSILDITRMAQSFGARIGDVKYNVRYDMDADGSISILDLTLAANYFGKKCTDLFPA